MDEIRNGITIVLVVCGAFFMLVGSIGVIRLPDFFSRSHATSKTDTLGIMLVLGGLAVYEGFTLSRLKLLIIIVFVVLANPVGSHALARAAYFIGLKPWVREGQSEKEAQ
jgi:multicomponent Na+:H+ antiporter subunit G